MVNLLFKLNQPQEFVSVSLATIVSSTTHKLKLTRRQKVTTSRSNNEMIKIYLLLLLVKLPLKENFLVSLCRGSSRVHFDSIICPTLKIRRWYHSPGGGCLTQSRVLPLYDGGASEEEEGASIPLIFPHFIMPFPYLVQRQRSRCCA